jgi:hypothetical protein
MSKLLIILLFLLYPNIVCAAQQYYWLIPGYTTTGKVKGWEASLLRNVNQHEGEDGFGLVFGGSFQPSEHFIEVQAQTSGWALFALSGGAGVFYSPTVRGLQATIAGQFFTPFLMFTRIQVRVRPDIKVQRPMVGLMFKLPVLLYGR